MLKKSIVFIIMSFLTIGLFSQSTNAKTWANLYKKAISIAEKKQKMDQIFNVANQDFEGFVKDVLIEQIDYPVPKEVKEKKIYNELIFKTIQLAEKLKITGASGSIKTLYYKIDELNYRGEILYILGKLGDKSILPWLISEMGIANDLHRNGKSAGKYDIVDGAIKGLSFFKDPSSFDVLFYAAVPNYSDKIRKVALETINSITSEPAKLCASYIKKENDFTLILEALRFANKSASKNEDKISASKAALEMTFDAATTPSDLVLETKKTVQNESVSYLGELKASDDEIVKLILRKWESDKLINSNIISIEALQKIGTQTAIDAIRSKLAFFNLKVKEGAGTGFSKDEGVKFTIALIRALGASKNQSALEELYDARSTTNYDKVIVDEAEKAIKNIGG